MGLRTPRRNTLPYIIIIMRTLFAGVALALLLALSYGEHSLYEMQSLLYEDALQEDSFKEEDTFVQADAVGKYKGKRAAKLGMDFRKKGRGLKPHLGKTYYDPVRKIHMVRNPGYTSRDASLSPNGKWNAGASAQDRRWLGRP